MNLWEKDAFFTELAIVRGYPLFFITYGKQLLFLIVHSIIFTGFIVTLRKFPCSRRMNLAGPSNKVRNETL